ncbi:MAG: 1-acyl-sn-glycerol-3-phosphate acyltransferase [Glaciecola sp.]
MVSEKIKPINANSDMSNSIKNILQLTVVFSFLTLTGTFAALLRLISFGGLVPFNRKYLIAWSSKVILQIVGIKLELPKSINITKAGTFITFNHNSYLDIFALTALGLSTTSFILSEKTLKIIPLTLSAYGIGVRYIPQKKHPKRRSLFFEKIEQVIRDGKLNIAGASEGVHNHHHGVDMFNKGVYRMAMNSKMTILPMFIYVPEESNPFNKYKYFKRGILKLEIMEEVDTINWNEDDLEKNVDFMRSRFVNKFNQLHHKQII